MTLIKVVQEFEKDSRWNEEALNNLISIIDSNQNISDILERIEAGLECGREHNPEVFNILIELSISGDVSKFETKLNKAMEQL